MQQQDYGGLDRYFNTLFRRMGRTYDFSLGREIDFSLARRVIDAWAEAGARVTIGAVMCHAVAAALALHPRLSRWPSGRRSFGDGRVVIGLPVHAPGVSRSYGVPAALTDAHTLPLPALTAELARLGAQARGGGAPPFNAIAALPGWAPVELGAALLGLAVRWSPRLARGTFGVPVLSIVPNADALALARGFGPCALAFGAVEPRAVVRGGELAVAPTARFVCAFDHRVASAVAAAEFMESVRRVVEVELAGRAPAGAAL